MDESLKIHCNPTLAEFYMAEGQRLAHTGSWAFKPDS